MINEIQIRNYKSISDVTVKLGHVTVLVGQSGTGKSNFVESVRFLRDVLTARQESPYQQQWAQIRPVPKTEVGTSFDIRFNVDGVDEEFGYEITFSPHGVNRPPEEEKLSLGKAVVFHQKGDPGRNSGEWLQEPPLVEVPRAGPIALGRMPSLADVVIAYTAITQGIGCYTFPNSLMLERKSNQSTKAGYHDDGSNFLETMKKIVSDLQDLSARKKILGALRRVNEGVGSIELNDLHNPSHAVVGHAFKDRTLGLQLSQESEGFRRFFAHMLALYQRPPKLLMIFEHPEDGIHPGALSLLADEFKATPEEGRGQIVLTTHSPGLLDCFDSDAIRVVERDGFHTKIGPLAEDQLESLNEQLLDPGELLTVDPARTETSEIVADAE